MGYSAGAQDFNGWAQYDDTQYSSSSPFEILDGQFVTLPNNAGENLTGFLPAGVSSYFDQATQKITPKNVGDYNIITIRFRAVASTSSTHLDFGIDIGGAFGVIFRDIKVFPKGAGVEHSFAFTCPGYSLNTFVANGGMVKLGAVGGDVEVYSISFQIARVHAA